MDNTKNFASIIGEWEVLKAQNYPRQRLLQVINGSHTGIAYTRITANLAIGMRRRILVIFLTSWIRR
jgi:hypothetical protein